MARQIALVWADACAKAEICVALKLEIALFDLEHHCGKRHCQMQRFAVSASRALSGRSCSKLRMSN